VLTVAPTFVRTELTAAQLDDPQTGPDLLAQIPLGRYATPADVADAILWGSRASMATGTSIVVDGGWTAR
jgi:2-deoxy-D-gluconate 3-dehydrogenase